MKLHPSHHQFLMLFLTASKIWVNHTWNAWRQSVQSMEIPNTSMLSDRHRSRILKEGLRKTCRKALHFKLRAGSCWFSSGKEPFRAVGVWWQWSHAAWQ